MVSRINFEDEDESTDRIRVRVRENERIYRRTCLYFGIGFGILGLILLGLAVWMQMG